MRTSDAPSHGQSATSHSYKEESFDPVSFPRVGERKKLYRDRSRLALPLVDAPASGSSSHTPVARTPIGTGLPRSSFASHADVLRCPIRFRPWARRWEFPPPGYQCESPSSKVENQTCHPGL